MKHLHVKTSLMTILTAMAVGGLLAGQALAAKAKEIEVTGELIDTWCYFSGVMGGEDAIRGTAHHTCALWCAAGGIPIGLRTQDNQVYMVLKLKGTGANTRSDQIMEIQSHVITAKGVHHVRDGVNYLVVQDVIADEGITYLNHEDYGSVPPNAFPLDEN